MVRVRVRVRVRKTKARQDITRQGQGKDKAKIKGETKRQDKSNSRHYTARINTRQDSVLVFAFAITHRVQP